MKKVLKYAWVVVLVALGILWFILSRGKVKPVPIGKELDAIDAEAEIEKVRIDLGEQKALQAVEKRYEQELKKLEAEDQVKVEKLKSNPAKLARLLVRRG